MVSRISEHVGFALIGFIAGYVLMFPVAIAVGLLTGGLGDDGMFWLFPLFALAVELTADYRGAETVAGIAFGFVGGLGWLGIGGAITGLVYAETRRWWGVPVFLLIHIALVAANIAVKAG